MITQKSDKKINKIDEISKDSQKNINKVLTNFYLRETLRNSLNVQFLLEKFSESDRQSVGQHFGIKVYENFIEKPRKISSKTTDLREPSRSERVERGDENENENERKGKGGKWRE